VVSRVTRPRDAIRSNRARYAFHFVPHAQSIRFHCSTRFPSSCFAVCTSTFIWEPFSSKLRLFFFFHHRKTRRSQLSIKQRPTTHTKSLKGLQENQCSAFDWLIYITISGYIPSVWQTTRTQIYCSSGGAIHNMVKQVFILKCNEA
jgi:hypothetical protein